MATREELSDVAVDLPELTPDQERERKIRAEMRRLAEEALRARGEL